jgi:hypothetical protein
MEFFNNNDEIQIENEGYSSFPEVSTQNEARSDINPGIGFDNNQFSNWQDQPTTSDPFSSYQIVFDYNIGRGGRKENYRKKS